MVFALDVVDNWRIKHPSEEIFLGPLTCKIQLYCICMSKELFNMVYKTANNSVHVMPEIILQKRKYLLQIERRRLCLFFWMKGNFQLFVDYPEKSFLETLAVHSFHAIQKVSIVHHESVLFCIKYCYSFLHESYPFLIYWKLCFALFHYVFFSICPSHKRIWEAGSVLEFLN